MAIKKRNAADLTKRNERHLEREIDELKKADKRPRKLLSESNASNSAGAIGSSD